ncbi:MAG TPA: methyltransferase domain-containing protein [Pyrinomonadaceae bacterium]
MSIEDKWRAVIDEGHAIRLVDEGIYSALPEGPHDHLYDRRAVAYDLVVGTRLYNRVMWGAFRADYDEFARQATAAHPDGMLLDAACGSLLFTASAYLDCERPILAFDQSMHMLRRARSRLRKLVGSVPERIFLLQADLSALPFRQKSFHTALCMNVLHHVADAGNVITGLKELLVDGGQLYLTSLVRGNRLLGDHYLNALHRRGDFVQPRTRAELEGLIASSFGQGASYWVRGNMAYATAASVLRRDAA